MTKKHLIFTTNRQLNIDHQKNQKTMQDMKANGSEVQIKDRVKEDRCGLMDQCTKVGGMTTRATLKAD